MPSDVDAGAPAQGDRSRPGRLTAQALRAIPLSQAGHSAGGLSEDDVQTFLASVAVALEAAEARRASLRAEVDRLRAYYLEQGADVDQPEERRDPATDDAVRRLRSRVPDLVAAAERYAARLPALPAAAAEEVLADSVRQVWRVAEDLLNPPPPAAPIRRDDVDRILRWLDAFVYAVQIQAREAYDALAPGPR